MKKLLFSDFKLAITTQDRKFYYSYEESGFEICLEPCLSGFCVAIYKQGPDERIADLVTDKKCTGFDFKRRGLSFGVDGLKKGEKNMVILRALKYANELKDKFIK